MPALGLAQLSIVDDFSDGNRLNGPSSTDVLVLRQLTGTNLTIDSVSPTIDGNALKVSGGGGFNPIIGVFSPGGITLANPGDFLTVSFDLQVPSGGSDFRFGLYNFNGTPTTTDEAALTSDLASASSSNDFGYRYSLTLAGISPSAGVFQETGVQPPAGGGETTQGTISNGAGADQLAFGATASSFSMTVTRTATNQVTIAVRQGDAGTGATGLNSILLRTATDGGTLREAGTPNAEATTNQFYATFNEVVLNNANSNVAYSIDNIRVTSNVPEPGTALALAVGGLALLSSRARHSRRRA